MEETVESRAWMKKKKKRKRLDVEMEVLSETSDRIAPLVGYFPSGFDPEHAEEEPSIRVFRSKKKSVRMDLVVRPKDSNVEFVGKSYAGEAAGPQLCTYALGVLDKERQSLKIVPIAANKIFRLEPRVIGNIPADTIPPEEINEGLTADKKGQRLAALTNLYGTKKDRVKDKKWRSLSQQRNDPTAQEHLESQIRDAELNKDALEDSKENAIRNIPPYDSSAITPEKAYLLDEIILKGERDHLSDILEIMESGAGFAFTFWQENGYPSFVINRIHKLREVQNEEEKWKLAFILSYITHLLKFFELASASRNSASIFRASASSQHRIPHIIYQKFLRIFVDPESHILSTEKKELLINYILVLTLFADDFHTAPSDIAKDLKMTPVSLKPYFALLGCSPKVEAKFQEAVYSLPAPLQFFELKKRRRKR